MNVIEEIVTVVAALDPELQVLVGDVVKAIAGSKTPSAAARAAQEAAQVDAFDEAMTRAKG